MHILITGAAGMIGRKLTERLVRDGALDGKPIEQAHADRHRRAGEAGGVFRQGRRSRRPTSRRPGEAARHIADAPDVIFHLAAIVSGEAELDFDKGYRINLDGTRALLDAIRAPATAIVPKFVFTSSIAVFGAPFPEAIPDDFHLTPLTSYGTQKAICELLLADYTRHGFLDGVGIRLPTHLRAARQAQQGGLRLLLRHHPRAARRPGGGAAGRRRRCCTGTRARARRSASSSMRRG